MILYGLHPVREALSAEDSRLERLLITRGKRNARLSEIVKLAKSRGVPVRFEPAAALKRQAGSKEHQDVLAVLAEVPLAGLGEILEAQPRLLLVVDHVEDPRNLGALLRTAEAAGVDGVLIPERRSSPLTSAVVKASAGAAMHLEIARIGNVSQIIDRLKEEGLWIVGLDARGRHRVGDLDANLPLAIVVGGEHKGLRAHVRKRCDFVVSLPMKGQVSSLNLSVAAGVLIYQIVFGRDAGSEG